MITSGESVIKSTSAIPEVVFVCHLRKSAEQTPYSEYIPYYISKLKKDVGMALPRSKGTRCRYTVRNRVLVRMPKFNTPGVNASAV